MGGPLVDEGGSILIVNAKDENEVREKLKNEPLDQARDLETGERKALADLCRQKEVTCGISDHRLLTTDTNH